MKKYIGTKSIYAEPMNADNALEKGYKIGKHAHEWGYEVEYKDGYKSWSPKKAFEDAYRSAETFLDRLLIEKEELETKYNGLTKFLYSKKHKTLPIEQQKLLVKQHIAMGDYLFALNQRIELVQNDKK